MPYRKPKRSYVLPVVALVAVAGPLLIHTALGPDKSTDQVQLAAVPPLLTELALQGAPDTMLPLTEFTGLELPGLRLSDLHALDTPSPLPAEPADPQLPGPGLGFVNDGTGDTPSADTPALTPGVIPPEFLDTVGAEVKELTRDEPFSMVALTARDLANTTVMVRARQPDGTWGQWYEADPIDGTGGAVAGAPTGTDPIYVGNTTAVQVLTTRAQQSPGGLLEPAPAAAGDEQQQPPPELTAVLIDPGRGAVDGQLEDIATALPGGGPRVITRAQWGADEAIRCQEPTYDDGLGGITVHHTAGRNDYSKSESAGIVRAVYAYHSKTLGWCDMGYNALVDKYGQIFEGRYGGLDKTVQGAHAGGFNENTSGVALMGDYQAEKPTDASIEAIGKFIGWRAKTAGLNPKGHTTMYSEGTEFTPYARGEEVRLPVVFAHRDVGNTSCPGDAAYAQMDRIRTIAATAAGGGGGTQPQPPRNDAARSDLAVLADLTAKLLTMVNDNLIAKYWASTGGPEGPLGQAASEPLPAAQGQQYAEFVNGHVYTTPDGQAHQVQGKILDRFLELGADAGALGLPLTNPYPVPEGLRADFQNGSLVLEQATDIVTTIWKTYNEAHRDQTEDGTTSPTPVPGTTSPPVPGTTSPPVPGTTSPPVPGTTSPPPPGATAPPTSGATQSAPGAPDRGAPTTTPAPQAPALAAPAPAQPTPTQPGPGQSAPAQPKGPVADHSEPADPAPAPEQAPTPPADPGAPVPDAAAPAQAPVAGHATPVPEQAPADTPPATTPPQLSESEPPQPGRSEAPPSGTPPEDTSPGAESPVAPESPAPAPPG